MKIQFGALVLFCLAVPSHASGQVVRGRLVEAGEEGGIGGAMVTLVDRNGRGAEQVLTRSNSGLFELKAPRPGQYRLRADRIGYATTFSDYFQLAAGDTLTIDITARVEAISLEGIEADPGRRCDVRPEEGLAVGRVWNEARKALAAAAWTQERGMYQYEMLRIKRRWDRRGREVESEDRIFGQTYSDAPYIARPADSLVAGGFARFSATESVFWAPDAAVLLSDPFLDAHCLRVASDRYEAQGLVGLAFEPVPGRETADIAGTMWLDRSTARLRWLDFGYVNLNIPNALLDASPGGRVAFETLPNGTWIVTSWNIRMFTAGETIHPLTGRPAATLDGITVEHGEVLQVHGTEGVVFEGDPGRRIVGTVFDTLQVGLPGARVFLEGSGNEVVTDAQGRFELTHLQPGVYTVHYTHPYLEQLWYEPEPSEVKVEEGAVAPVQVDFSAPSLEQVFDDICDGASGPSAPVIAGNRLTWRTGIVTGSVTDEAGNPVAGASVYLQANGFVAGGFLVEAANRLGGADEMENARLRTRERTSDSGFYRACWVPVDIPLEVLVVDRDEKIDRGALEAALGLNDLFPGRVQVITISGDAPYRTLDLRVGAGRD